ncbi:MAG: four helix bundle protein [Candidatus Moraniibacteriota bacterium]
MNKEDNKKIKSFTDLKVWQEGHNLVLMIYKTTNNFPQKEVYSLVDQMRRASVSITSNIAEGFGRQGYKDKLRFYYNSQGSLTELKNQLLVAKDVGYIKKKDFDELADQINLVHKILQGFMKKTKSFLKSNRPTGGS